MISYNHMYFLPTAPTKIEKVDVEKGAGLRLSGGDNGVTIRFPRVAAGSALTSFSVGIRHIDAGPHEFHAWMGKDQISIGCNGKTGDPVKAATGEVKLLCDERSKIGEVQLLCDELPGTFAPAFAGTAKYSVAIVRNGELVDSRTGQTGAFTIPDFDGEHDGAVETVGLEFTYGKRRKGAWTMTIVHPPYIVMLTAETDQPLSQEPVELRLTTRGLTDITLIAPTATFSPV